MRESEVERQFVEAVRAAGGQALKFTSQSMNGVPDRLVLLLGGKCAFVELKAPGKQMRLLQRKRRQQLEALGFPVFCVDRPEQIQPAIDALVHWNPGEPIPQGIGARIPDMPQVTLPESEVMPKCSSFRMIIRDTARSISRPIPLQLFSWIWAWAEEKPSSPFPQSKTSC